VHELQLFYIYSFGLCPPAPLKSLTFCRYTNQIIIVVVVVVVVVIIIII